MSKSYYVPSNRTDASKVKFKDENFPNVNNVKDALKQLKQSSSLIDLSSYALKTDIPTVTNDLTDTLKSNYDKAYAHSQSKHFDGNYNNLTDKPIIPSIEGLATETYINNMIAFNDNGELVITINGVSKIFVPKTVE